MKRLRLKSFSCRTRKRFADVWCIEKKETKPESEPVYRSVVSEQQKLRESGRAKRRLSTDAATDGPQTRVASLSL